MDGLSAQLIDRNSTLCFLTSPFPHNSPSSRVSYPVASSISFSFHPHPVMPTPTTPSPTTGGPCLPLTDGSSSSSLRAPGASSTGRASSTLSCSTPVCGRSPRPKTTSRSAWRPCSTGWTWWSGASASSAPRGWAGSTRRIVHGPEVQGPKVQGHRVQGPQGRRTIW